MAIQLYVGLVTEGVTDSRFIPDILEKLLIDIASDCRSEVRIESIFPIPKESGAFVDVMTNAAKYANDNGASILCIHADSDARNIREVYDYKIDPFLEALTQVPEEEYCKNIIPIIPIQMIESWMMADKDLLKERINAKGVRDEDLGLHRPPENYADPKLAIEHAITIAQKSRPRRRRNLVTIADLYGEIGALLELEILRRLPSFRHFEEQARQVFRSLGYLE